MGWLNIAPLCLVSMFLFLWAWRSRHTPHRTHTHYVKLFPSEVFNRPVASLPSVTGTDSVSCLSALMPLFYCSRSLLCGSKKLTCCPCKIDLKVRWKRGWWLRQTVNSGDADWELQTMASFTGADLNCFTFLLLRLGVCECVWLVPICRLIGQVSPSFLPNWMSEKR